MHLFTILFSAVLATTLSSSSAFTVSSPTRQGQGIRNRNGFPVLNFSVDDIEYKALAAAEAWDIHVTSFLATKEAGMVEERLQNRADVSCIRVGGRGAESSRARFVFSNPELGIDADAAEAEHCAVVLVKNAKSNSDTWPDILSRAGVAATTNTNYHQLRYAQTSSTLIFRNYVDNGPFYTPCGGGFGHEYASCITLR